MSEEEKVEGTPEETQEEKVEETTAEEEGKQVEEDKEPEDKTDDTPSEDVDYSQQEESEVADALKGKGFDYDALCQEYATTGTLSEKTKAALAEVGINETIINNYIVGMTAKYEQDCNELAEAVGGRKKFDEILDWTAHNVGPDEIRYINTIRNKQALKVYLRDLKVRMEEKEGKQPEYQTGNGDKPSVNMFNSQAEMFEAIKNPKYRNDEYYRSLVQKKIAASREAGIDLGIY